MISAIDMSMMHHYIDFSLRRGFLRAFQLYAFYNDRARAARVTSSSRITTPFTIRHDIFGLRAASA